MKLALNLIDVQPWPDWRAVLAASLLATDCYYETYPDHHYRSYSYYDDGYHHRDANYRVSYREARAWVPGHWAGDVWIRGYWR